MNLYDILEEISIGFNSNNVESRILKKHVNEIINFLNEGIDEESLHFKSFEIESPIVENEKIFLQGSYATSTAIKTKDIEVDADIGIVFNTIINRVELFKKLKNKYRDNVHLKKPCITIDFEDGYSIDLAVYSEKEGNKKYFLNSISGLEDRNLAIPQVLVKDLKNALSKDNDKRDIIRLSKYFIKNIENNLCIEEENSIPSIALILFIKDYTLNGKNLEEKLNNFLKDFKYYCQIKNYSVNYEEYYIYDIFRKITNVQTVDNTLNRVIGLSVQKDYSQLIQNSLNEKIKTKLENPYIEEMLGTMG